MGQFLVKPVCAPGFQYGGALYKPGEVVVIPKERSDQMAYSLGGLDGKTKVFDKLEPLDDEAKEMSS